MADCETEAWLLNTVLMILHCIYGCFETFDKRRGGFSICDFSFFFMSLKALSFVNARDSATYKLYHSFNKDSFAASETLTLPKSAGTARKNHTCSE